MVSQEFIDMIQGALLFTWIFTLVAYVFYSVCYMQIFYKAGRERWKAWVPFVNTWTLLDICGLPGWLMLLAFVPLVNIAFIVISFIMTFRLPICFEKTGLWGVLNILFPFVIIPIIAFDSSEYCGYEKG